MNLRKRKQIPKVRYDVFQKRNGFNTLNGRCMYVTKK